MHVVGGPSTIDATGLDNGIVGDASVTSGALVEQLTVQNSTYQGVYIGGSKGVRLLNCTIHASGIESQSAGLRSDDAQFSIENSEVSGSGGAGIRVVTSDLTLKGSHVVGNAGAGLRAEDSKAAVVNNVMEKNAGAGTRITHGSTATQILARNQLNGNNLGVRIEAGRRPAFPAPSKCAGRRSSENVGSGALLLGNSTLDLGTASRGANSFAGKNAPFAVVNASTAQAPLPAESNWWGTADPAAIAALMSGPVDFVPFLMSPPH